MTIIKILALTLFLVFFLSCGKSEQILPGKFQFDGESDGCYDIHVFRATKDRTKTITVIADKKKLKLSTSPQTFEIADSNAINVFIEDFGKSEFTNREGYCTDFVNGGDNPIRIPAIRGKVAVTLANDSRGHINKATVILENVIFQTPENQTFNIEKVEIKDVRVGWLPG